MSLNTKAEREGFEPPKPVTAYLVSNEPHSSTPPPPHFHVSFHAVRLCLKFLFIYYSTKVYALHTTTLKSWERYVSISSLTLTPTRANDYVGENQKSCCRGRNRTYGCLQNQNLTCRLYTTRQCDFRNCTGNLWLT